MDNTIINEGHIDPSACARSGLDPAVYDSHFTDGVQTKCAAGEYCLQPRDVPVANSFHRCMVCTLRMHSYVTCGDTYESFKSDHGIPSLPPYGQYMVARYADREEELHICGSCIEKFSSNNTSPSLSTSNVTPAGNDEVDFSSDVGPYEHAAGDETGADDDDDADTEVATITDSTNGGLVLPADPTQWSKDHWQHWVQTKMTWKDIRITLTSCNHTGASQSSPMTRVRGIAVTATYEKPIVGVTVEHWRPIYMKFFNRLCRGMRKEKICENMIDYCAAREKDGSSANVVSPPVDDQGRIITFNVFHFLNVLFSDKFKPRFATRGRALMKEDYDSGVTPDQTLFTEFLEAYNDRENAVYGTHAHKQLPQVKSAADFDNIDISHWLKVREKFKALFKLYEEFTISCTVSGTHCSHEECEDVTEEQIKKCKNAAVKYMHYFLLSKSNHDLLAAATGSLPNNVFRQSGSNAHRREEQCTSSEHGGAVRAGRGRPKGARSGGGGREGDSSAATQKDISTSNAFESIATRNDVMTHSELVRLEKYYSEELVTEKAKKRTLMKEFTDECCGKDRMMASDRIKAAKHRKKDEDNDAESVSSEFSTKSEEFIQSIIASKDRIKMLASQHKKTDDCVRKQYKF